MILKWFFERGHVGVPDAMSTARQFVEDHWSDLDPKLRVLSGKKLLSSIRREAQDKCGVDFGNVVNRTIECLIRPDDVVHVLRPTEPRRYRIVDQAWIARGEGVGGPYVPSHR